MANDKYEFTGETQVVTGVTLQRIRRKSDGVVGGWIEKEANLAVTGAAWVSGDAVVSGDAWVFGAAWVSGDAVVSGDAWVFGAAEVSGAATVSKPLDFVHVAGLRWPVTVRNDGFASIGCQTRRLRAWLQIRFTDQTDMKCAEEFQQTFELLAPIFQLFQTRFEQTQAKGPGNVVPSDSESVD